MPLMSICREETENGLSYDLEFYPLTVELDGTDLEVNADSGDKGRCPCVVAKPKQQTRLSNAFGRIKEC